MKLIMINAWSLLYEELNGTMDETYPIKKQEDSMSDGDVTLGLTTNSFSSGDTIMFAGLNTAIGAAETVPIDNSWWSDDGFSVTGNPAGSSQDTISFGSSITGSRVPGGMGEDHIHIETRPWVYESPDGGTTVTRRRAGDDYTKKEVIEGNYFGDSYPYVQNYLADNDDQASHHFTTKPEPDLNYKSQKYEEDKGISDLKDYVSSTYRGHYTNKNSDTQTLDLIHSVGDAESFCRSNALKYLSRYDKKGSAKQDILKAMHYCLLLYYFSGHTKEPDYTNTRYETF